MEKEKKQQLQQTRIQTNKQTNSEQTQKYNA